MERLAAAVKRANLNDESSMSNNATLAVFATQESEDTLPFYEVEGRVLALWDQLKELKLEEALLEAQLTLPLGALVASDIFNTR